MSSNQYIAILTGWLAFTIAPAAFANPQGMTVVQGSATATTSGSRLTVTASQNSFLNWQSFNIASGQTTIFQQPSSSSVVWNQINSAVPSRIWGSLNANGVVVLMNSSGFFFGPNSEVKAAGFVASTATVPPELTGGSQWAFNGAPPSAKIVNYGKIDVQPGGSLFLIGGEINNHGTLSAPGGNIALGAGQQVLVGDRPDGHGLNIAVTLPAGTINNKGQVIATGGSILASAQTVNQNGLIQANSIREKDGVIELVAGDAINLGANSAINAKGTGAAASDGGQITIKSGDSFSDASGSVISAAGGPHGGNGGNVEISAPNMLSLNSHLDAIAQPGYLSGRLLLDPKFILLDTSGSGSAGSGTIAAGNNPGTTLDLNVNTAFVGFSQITLEATQDITLVKNTAWNLSLSTHQMNGQLALEAGNNIIFQDGSSISDANNWSVTLKAGVNNFATGGLAPGQGSIYLNGGDGLANGGSIQTGAGPINLAAGKDIQTGNGSLDDENGSAISLASAAGSITLNAGNNIQISSAVVETTAGGDINLTAAQNVNIDTGIITANGGGKVTAAATAGSVTVGAEFIQTDTGSVSLSAGQNVEVDGSVQSGSGSITLTAGQGIITGAGALQDENFNAFTLSSGADATGALSLSAGTTIQISSGSVETTAGAPINLTGAQGISTDGGSVFAMGGGKITAKATTGSLIVGSGFVRSDSGDISLTAQQDVLVGTGSVTTTAGGNIAVTATTGSVNTGTDANGYSFNQDAPPSVNVGSLGGISTGAGGNVTINAKQNVTSYLPLDGTSGDAGTGAFAGGNVTINGGGNVTGHYVVTDGTGVIGTSLDPVNNAGTSQNQLALSLTAGSWSVNATHNIVLQEVRNPNGIFNIKGIPTTPTYHGFDYAPDASVTLTANTVELAGGNLPRNSGESIPSIYPPELAINAGAGGILLDRDVILFPSAQGLLDITSAGSLTGPSALIPTQLIMSDSGQTQFSSSSTFGSGDHDARMPVHLNNQTVCQLTIGGDMDNISLTVPEAAQVTVTGNMNNCAFLGQNLHGGDNTIIKVTGDIFNVNNISSVTLSLSSVPDLELLTFAVPDLSGLFNKLSYNPTTGTLSVQGQMTPDELASLFSFQIPVLNAFGKPATGANDQPILQTVNLFDKNDPAVVTALDSLQSASQKVPANPGAGYTIGGPGTLTVTARNLDLGDTQGIQSVGPKNNPVLAQYIYNPSAPFDAGADINVTLTGNLTMFSTTISTLAGGEITVDAGGSIVAGSSLVPPGDILPRGIFTVAKSDVTVTADGDIDLDGSRIAAYDGGNVTVLSRTGDVNAGSGGTGASSVEEVVIVPVHDSKTGKITSYFVDTYTPTIPGSGVLATTFPGSSDPNFPASKNTVGNITITTPQGDIIANAGGVLQLPLNGVSASKATVTLNAGSPGFTGSIDASGSGVIGANVTLSATGDIKGVVVAQNNLNLTSSQNVSVTAVAAGDANVSAGGSISGTIVGVGGISASAGTSIGASLLSQNVNTSGAVSGQVGFAAANTAGATSQAASSDDRAKTAATSDTPNTDDEEAKKKKHPVLARIGRVTVFLPGKADK